MKEKEMKDDSITSAGLIILVCGVLFIAIGVLIGIPSFFGASQPNPLVNLILLLGTVVLVIGIILTAHGVAANTKHRNLQPAFFLLSFST